MSPWCFLPSFESTDLSVEKKHKIDFQDRGHGGYLGFLIGTILAILYLQVSLMLPTNIGKLMHYTSQLVLQALPFRKRATSHVVSTGIVEHTSAYNIPEYGFCLEKISHRQIPKE